MVLIADRSFFMRIQMSLNPYQQNYLYASLSSFEKALRLADQLLVEGGQRGILYYQKSHLDLGLLQSARNKPGSSRACQPGQPARNRSAGRKF
jgi:hypothetical protein